VTIGLPAPPPERRWPFRRGGGRVDAPGSRLVGAKDEVVDHLGASPGMVIVTGVLAVCLFNVPGIIVRQTSRACLPT
jgi:hypothetical protein